MATMNLPWLERATNVQCMPIVDAIHRQSDCGEATNWEVRADRAFMRIDTDLRDAVDRELERQWPQ